MNDDDQSWPDDAAETHLGRYELVRRLGKGGMGEVFLAKAQGARGFEKFVAIKRILPQYSANKHVVNMLVDEARISVLLNHPNVVQVMELDEDQGSHFIVMEYVDGHAVSRLIRRLRKRGERFDPLVASYIMIQVLEGLHAAHTQHDASGQLAGIIHRDVSPQNVLISMSGQVKVIDFGIARARDRLEATQGAQVKGKLRYMAPEQIKPSMAGGAGIDHRVDVFAAGIVLFEMLAMRQRFPQTGDIEIIDAILETDPPDLEREGLVDRELMDVVRTALCRERKRRFKDAAAFAAALRGYLYARDPSFNGERLAKVMRRVFLEKGDEGGDDVDNAGNNAAKRPAPRERDKNERRAERARADVNTNDDGDDADDVTRTQFRPQSKAATATTPAQAAPHTTSQRPPATRRSGIPAPVIGAALGAVVLLGLGLVARSAMAPQQLDPGVVVTAPTTVPAPPTPTSTTTPTPTTTTTAPPTPTTALTTAPGLVDFGQGLELIVEVIPASATITRTYVPDPKYVSPARLKVQKGETVDLQFDAVGYKSQRKKFLVDGSSPKVLVELEAIPIPLIIRPVPRDAEITVNGSPYKGTRTTVTPGSQVTITGHHPFYFDAERTLFATPGLQQLVVDLTLEERPVPSKVGTPGTSNTATLSIQSTPSGAEVFVDGIIMGRTPTDLRVGAGAHRVTVRGKEAESTFAISVEAGETFRRTVALQ